MKKYLNCPQNFNLQVGAGEMGKMKKEKKSIKLIASPFVLIGMIIMLVMS